MNRTKNAILLTLFVCMGQGKNHYTKISLDVLIQKLHCIHKITVKRRWIFQCLRDLLDAGIITRRQRYKHFSNGTIYQYSSMISITIKGTRHLVRNKVMGAAKHLKNIMKFVTCKDKRWPGKKDVADSSYWPDGPDEKKHLEQLLTGVGRSP